MNRQLAGGVKLVHDFYHTHTFSCLQVLCNSNLHPLSFSVSVSVSLTKIFSIALYSNKQKHSSCKGHCSRKRNQRTYLCCKSNTTNVVYAATPSFHTLSLSMHMASQLTHYFIKENTFCNLSYKDYFEHTQIQIRNLFICMRVCANKYVYGHLIWLWGYFAFVSGFVIKYHLRRMYVQEKDWCQKIWHFHIDAHTHSNSHWYIIHVKSIAKQNAS